MKQNLAFVFPGQGSQQVGMLGELAGQHSIITDTFTEASDALGYDLWKLVQEGPVEDLNSTDKTQPALMTASIALWRLWLEQGGAKPALVAGHSLGEYTALVAADVFTLAEGAKLLKARGEFMQQAVPPGKGKMAAILGLDDAVVEKACADASGETLVSAANYNTPGQIVIAGESGAVQRAIEICTEAGAKRALELAVSVPSHCQLMQPAAESLGNIFDTIEFKEPAIAVMQNYTASIPTDLAELKQNLLAQLCNPVLWSTTVSNMAEQGIDTVIECGPGKVLSGLNKRIVRSLNVAAISDVAGLEKALSL